MKDVLEVNLYNVTIVTKEEEKEQDIGLLGDILSAKRIEGCSEKTLTYYKNTIHQMMEGIGKTVCTIETEDLRTYLSKYQAEKESSKVTIDNIRRIFFKFFCMAGRRGLHHQKSGTQNT